MNPQKMMPCWRWTSPRQAEVEEAEAAPRREVEVVLSLKEVGPGVLSGDVEVALPSKREALGPAALSMVSMEAETAMLLPGKFGAAVSRKKGLASQRWPW